MMSILRMYCLCIFISMTLCAPMGNLEQSLKEETQKNSKRGLKHEKNNIAEDYHVDASEYGEIMENDYNFDDADDDVMNGQAVAMQENEDNVFDITAPGDDGEEEEVDENAEENDLSFDIVDKSSPKQQKRNEILSDFDDSYDDETPEDVNDEKSVYDLDEHKDTPVNQETKEESDKTFSWPVDEGDDANADGDDIPIDNYDVENDDDDSYDDEAPHEYYDYDESDSDDDDEKPKRTHSVHDKYDDQTQSNNIRSPKATHQTRDEVVKGAVIMRQHKSHDTRHTIRSKDKSHDIRQTIRSKDRSHDTRHDSRSKNNEEIKAVNEDLLDDTSEGSEKSDEEEFILKK